MQQIRSHINLSAVQLSRENYICTVDGKYLFQGQNSKEEAIVARQLTEFFANNPSMELSEVKVTCVIEASLKKKEDW